MSDRFEPLNSGEVVSVHNDTQVLSGHRTFRVGELSDAIKAQLANAIAGWSEEKNGWFTPEGIDCEALRFGSNGWKKGRIRLCLEFCPDEPKSDTDTTTTATGVAVSQYANPQIHQPEPVAHTEIHNHSSDELYSAVTTPTPVLATPSTAMNAAIPVIGLAAATAVTTTALATGLPQVSAEEIASDRRQILAEPEVILEPEMLPDTAADRRERLDEIAIDFPHNDRGRIGSNAMMELDLTDLGLEIDDRDLLDFEIHGLPDGAHEFINLQDLDDRPENSGMLIDEVWNEMSQPNWPGIN